MPTGLASGPDGSIYIADTGNNRIRRVDPSGTISTVAGSQNGVPSFYVVSPDPCCYGGDGGPATGARLNAPLGLDVGPDGILYIADTNNGVVRKVDKSGTITRFAGAPFPGTISYPQPAAKAYLGSPASVTLLGDGSLIIGSFEVFKLTSDGVVNQYGDPFALNGVAESNFTAAADPNGVVYASDAPLNVVWKMPAAGQMQIFAGQFYFGFGAEGGMATGPNLHGPQGMAVAPDGSVYVADSFNHRVRKISPDGTIRTVAGSGTAGDSGDGGPPDSAQLGTPGGVALDASGALYIADTGNSAIWKLPGDGTIRSLASTNSATGQIRLPFSFPRGLVVESNGDIVVWLDGRGNSSTPPTVMMLTGNTAVDLIAIESGFNITHPAYVGISLDSSGNLLLSDGPSIGRFRADGTFVNAAIIGYVGAFSLTPGGDIFVATSPGRIKQQVGTAFPTLFNRDLSEFLGTQDAAYAFTPPTNPTSFATDAQGNLYIADRDLHRIRKLAAGSCRGIPGPVAGSPVNSATLHATFTISEKESAAPGELMTIFGTGLGPPQGIGPVLDPATGLVPTTLGGVRVTFDGVPAPILYAGDKQINTIAPFTTYGRASAKVTVEVNGVPADDSIIPVADTFPRVFAAGVQPIVVNSDETLNSSTNPAKAGSYVTFYMTGLGRTNPPGIDGHLASIPLPTPSIPLTTDDPFKILYAGDAFSIVEGAIQVNLQLPANAFGGGMQVPLHSGTFTTTVVVNVH